MILIVSRQRATRLFAVFAGCYFWPAAIFAQGPEAKSDESRSRPEHLPAALTREHFSALREHSPFLRTLDLSRSLVLTGIARIEDETVATVVNLQTRQSYTLSQKEPNPDGWQLVEVKGEASDVESLTAMVKVGGAEIVSVRYEKTPASMKFGPGGVAVSTRIGNGKPGGGTGPHGGPDPRVLTPDQLADARNGARNIRAGFQADGYADNTPIPPAVISKLSRLSPQQRESVNVKMYEYRNRGLGMPERQKIYNNLLDRELQQR